MRRTCRLSLSALLCAAALSALAAPAQADRPRARASVLSAGFERGFGPWQLQARPGRVTLVGRPVAKGRRAARFEVRGNEREPRTGAQRAEVYASSPQLRAGRTYYVRDRIRLGANFDDSAHFRSWRIVQQLHEVGIICPPGLAVFVDPGPRFGLRSGTSRPSFWRSQNLQRSRWYRLVYAVHLSSRPSRGWVRVWLDGKPQTLENGQQTMYGTTLKASRGFLKLGLYRSPFFKDTGVVFHDDVAVTRSLTGQ